VKTDDSSADQECALNGKLVNGSCQCDPQWSGVACGQLRLLPTPRNSGFEGGGDGRGQRNSSAVASTWGGSVIQDPTTKEYVMFVSRMSHHCGLSAWKTNSEIVQAVATSPTGPYVQRGSAVLGRFAHNPSIHASKSGAIFLFHIGCGKNSTQPITDCVNGTTNSPDLDREKLLRSSTASAAGGCDGPHYTTGMSAPSLAGPWTQFKKEITLKSSRAGNTAHITNPCVLAERNSGLLRWIYRQPAQDWPSIPSNQTSERIGIATADSWSSAELQDLTPHAPLFPFALEDAFIWQNRRGEYHALTHKGAGVSGHLYSRDGLSWAIGGTSPYNTTLAFTDGTSLEVGKRARPQLLLSAAGDPLLLTTGCGLRGDGDFVFTSVQPIAQS